MFPKPKPLLKPNTYAYESEPMVKPTGFREYDARWLFGSEINLMGVEALGLGLGTLITTNHILYEDDVRTILGLPDDVSTFAIMPIGYPVGRYGPLSRRPVSEVAFSERWGENWPSG